ncbi:MAG: restriction endonuclease subunit S [Lachnospiraceae bacterium]|nr:restriction endonuclease subunit S [Lachnospiraceae bacterium]
MCIVDEVPFEIPDSWEWVRLGTILHKLTDGTHSRPQYVDSGIPFVSVKDISSGKLDFSNCKYITEQEHRELYNRCNPEYGDILLSKVGTTGIPVIVDCNDQFSLFVSVALLKFNQNLLDKEYLKYLICSPLVQKQATENTRGVGNKNWVMRDIANTLIVIPPLSEQKRIVEKIHTMQPFINRYDIVYKKIDYLNTSFPDNLKKSILQWAVQGKLVPQDPSDEPAEVLLERIRDEKQQLIKEGKIKKDKHESVIFRRDNSHYEKLDGMEHCIDEELPFDIPKSWCWCRLKSIVNIVSARRVHQSDWRSEGVPFYRAREIGKLADIGYVENELYITEALYTELASSGVPHGGDLMVTAVGTLGKTYIVKDNDRFYYKDASVICMENFSKVTRHI